MVSDRRSQQYDRTLKPVSRSVSLSVPAKHIVRPAPVQPTVVKESSIAVKQPQPVAVQPAPVAFHPVVEEPKSPIIHMEDLFDVPAKPAPAVTTVAPVAAVAAPVVKTEPVKTVQVAPKVETTELARQPEQPVAVAAVAPQPSVVLPYIDTGSYSPFTPTSAIVGGEVKKEEKHVVKLAKHVAKGTTKTIKHVGKIAKKIKDKKKTASQKQPTAPVVSQFTPGVSPTAFLSSNDNFVAQPVPAPHVNVTEQVLASATETSAAPVANETPAMPTLVDNYGGVAIADDGFFGKLNRLSNTKITFSVNIKKKQIFGILRTILILTILAISGYLAWDTWMTNREAQEMFSNPTSSLSINSIAAIDPDNPDSLDTTSVSNQAIVSHNVPADQPRYISIPSIGINGARVFSVGVNSNGNIDVPKNVNDTAWYDGSAKPGQNGAVFINGHTSFSRSYRGIFDDLVKIEIGDKITIERGDGKSFTYKVVAKETNPRADVNMNKALNVQDGAIQGLTLMTCTGSYDYRAGGASDRLIVYAVLE